MGACRSNELYEMKIEDVKDLNTTLIITIPKTKTKVVRSFIITDQFYGIVKKYIDLRPSHVTTSSFFLNYQKGKCTIQRIGKNKFTVIGKQIATYLNLPNPERYTGHCFRRSSATLYVDGGGDITGLKRHGGWKSSLVAEGYIDQSVNNKRITAETISKQVNNATASTATAAKVVNADSITTVENTSNHNITQNLPSSVQFIYLSNINVNFVENK